MALFSDGKTFPVLCENSWETCSEFLAHFYLKSVPQKTDSWMEINWSRCRVKKYSQPISWVVFYSAGIFRTSSLGSSTLNNPERTALRRWREEPGFREVLQQRQDSLNVKRYLLIKENQISQVKKCRAFPSMGFPGGSAVKNLPANQETRVQSLGWEGPLGKEMAIHNSYLAGKSRGQRSLEGDSPCGCRVRHDRTIEQYAWEDARVWDHWNHSFDVHLSYLGPVSPLKRPNPWNLQAS